MEKKVDRIKGIMDTVYGAFSDTDSWNPKPFQENKSRYLWTDAYGVINYINLFCYTKEKRYLNQAKALVANVHEILGKTRDGKKRLGKASDDHPTLGGLRIGKVENEGPSMQQDGQYYHYLTKWIFALNRLAFVTQDNLYNQWAVELAKAIHPKFVKKTPSGLAQRMYWKMSIDLSKPLVNSEGGLDSYDGYVIYCILRDSSDDSTILAEEIKDLKTLVDVRYKSYSTHDALDAGEALWLSSWRQEELWAQRVASVAKNAVNLLKDERQFDGSPSNRLAFQEFGTTIGVQMYQDMMSNHGWLELNDRLHEFWFKHLYKRDCDITPIMYCSSLFTGVLNTNYSF